MLICFRVLFLSRGQEVFYPFLSLPDRTVYKDYYEFISHPVSLRAIFKLVRGTDRRKTSVKGNRFKNWQAFEDEVRYLWVNAREFNEDDSEIVAISYKLEVISHDGPVVVFLNLRLTSVRTIFVDELQRRRKLYRTLRKQTTMMLHPPGSSSG